MNNTRDDATTDGDLSGVQEERSHLANSVSGETGSGPIPRGNVPNLDDLDRVRNSERRFRERQIL